MPPTNDDFADAITLSGETGTISGTNVGATLETGEPPPTSIWDTGDASVWWKWTGNTAGVLDVTLTGATFFVAFDVFTGPAVDDLTPVPFAQTSAFHVPVDPGVTYYIRINGSAPGDEGTLTLDWDLKYGFVMAGALSGIGDSGLVISRTADFYEDFGSLLVVFADDTQTVQILTWPGSVDAGWAVEATHTAQGKKVWLFTKVCTTAEPDDYLVSFSSPSTIYAAAYLLDYPRNTDPIRAYDFADSPSGTTFDMPSLTATDPAELWALLWSHPVTMAWPGGRLEPPLSMEDLGAGAGGGGSADAAWSPVARQRLEGSDGATGIRTFTVDSDSYTDAIGLALLAGTYGAVAAVGAWGVGMVRMGAN